MSDLNELQPPEDPPQKLSNGWRVSKPYTASKQTAWVRRMVEESLAGPRPLPPIIPTHFNGKLIADLSSSEREDFHLSMQTNAMRPLLEAQRLRDPAEDEGYWKEKFSKPIPEEAQIRNEDGSVNIGARSLVDNDGLPLMDVEILRAHRKNSKNTMGTTDLSSMTPERRAKSMQAFTYSKPADPKAEDLSRLTKLTEVKAVQPTPDIPRPRKRSFWDRLFGRNKFDADAWDLHDPSTWMKGDHNGD